MPPGVPPSSCTSRPVALAGMHARLGGGGRWFGIEAGALVFQGWPTEDLDRPGWAVWPELKMRFGPPTLHGVLGVGSDLPTTLRRPAFLYAGGGANFDWGGFDVRGGFNRAGPALWDDFAPRARRSDEIAHLAESSSPLGLRCKSPTRDRSSDGKLIGRADRSLLGRPTVRSLATRVIQEVHCTHEALATLRRAHARNRRNPWRRS